MATPGKSVPKIVYDAGAGDVTIQFEYPPQGLDYEGRNIKFVGKISESSNGNYQNSDNYTEEERNLTFKQISQTILDEVETFFLWAGSTRKTFKYYVDSDQVEFVTVQLSKKQRGFRPKRTGWNTSNVFTYEFKLNMRRAL
jgi:hypothetical protein